VTETGGADGLAAAYRTLIRACTFLAESLQARALHGRDGSDVLRGAGGARVVGNGLRELDRFLCLLLDEAVARVAPPGFDRRAYQRRRNAAIKLREFHRLTGSDSLDGARLRAIGRLRACLHHVSGIVHDPGLYRDVRIAAGTSGDAAPSALRLPITFDDLAAICRFYAALAGTIIAACDRAEPVP
jgi:hypothetical protein